MTLSRQATLLAVAALCLIARVQAESEDEEYLLLKVENAESISSLTQAFANALDECFEASAWRSTEVNLTQIIAHGGSFLTQERAAHDIDRDFRCIRTQLGQNDIWLSSGSVQQGNETAITTVHQWTAPSRPNIVLALADDLGWADVGWHTYSETGLESATPFLDTLLPESTRLERMYTAPICSPSRAQLWTGRYFYRYGHGPAVTSGGTYGLSGRETTLSEILKGDGYHTAILGKWHLGYQDERLWPTFRGFDNHVGPFSLCWTSRVNDKSFRAKFLAQELFEDSLPGLSTLHNASIKAERLSFAGELPPLMDLHTTDPAYETMHNTDILKYESERYVHTYYASEARHKPLFLNVAFRSPHTPLEAPSRYATDKTLQELFVHDQVTNLRREYLRMVHAMDAAIEKMVFALQSEYVWDDTVFIFTSDNGGLDTRLGGASNWPLMGSKNAVWEGGIRVSTLVRGTLSPLARLESAVKGGTNEVYMHFVDFLPTIASGIAGISSEQYAQAWKCAHCLPHNNNTLDGVNRWRTIQTGESSRPDELRVLSVVTEEQADLIEDIDLLPDFVPRAVWDPQVYKGTQFESLVDPTYAVDWTHAHNRVRVHGGGAVQFGPYKLAWGQSYAAHKLREDPFHIVTTHLRPDIFRRTNWNLPIRSPIDYGGLPRGHTDLVFLYNVEDDPNERVNLLRRKKIPNKVIEIVRTMADFYKRTQQPDRAITDNHFRYAASFDPAELVISNETSQFFYPFCNVSLRCVYDLPVIQSFETTAEPTLQPTPSPSVPPSTVKEIEIPSTPAPSSSPTQAPTLTPRQFRASLGRKRAVRLPRTRSFPGKCKAFLLLSKEIAATPVQVSTVRAYGRTWWKACLALCVKTLEDSCRGVSSTPRQSGSYECSIYGPGLEVATRSPDSNLLHAVLDPWTCDI